MKANGHCALNRWRAARKIWTSSMGRPQVRSDLLKRRILHFDNSYRRPLRETWLQPVSLMATLKRLASRLNLQALSCLTRWLVKMIMQAPIRGSRTVVAALIKISPRSGLKSCGGLTIVATNSSKRSLSCKDLTVSLRTTFSCSTRR